MSIARSARIYFTLTKQNDVVNGLRCQSAGLQEYISPLLRRTMSSMGYEVNRPVCKKSITLTKETDVVNGLRCQSPGLREYISSLLRRTMSSVGYDVNRPV